MKNRTLIILALTLGAVLAIGGYSLGAAKSSPVIHACVNNKTHVITKRAGAACPKGTDGLWWDQQDVPSTAGPSGLDTITVKATGQGSASAWCPASHPYVLGGGGSGYELENSYPVEGSSSPSPSPSPTLTSASPSPSPTSASPSPTPAADSVTTTPASTTGGWYVSNWDGPNENIDAYAICAK
jgi:hypothetical protein